MRGGTRRRQLRHMSTVCKTAALTVSFTSGVEVVPPRSRRSITVHGQEPGQRGRRRDVQSPTFLPQKGTSLMRLDSGLDRPTFPTILMSYAVVALYDCTCALPVGVTTVPLLQHCWLRWVHC